MEIFLEIKKRIEKVSRIHLVSRMLEDVNECLLTKEYGWMTEKLTNMEC